MTYRRRRGLGGRGSAESGAEPRISDPAKRRFQLSVGVVVGSLIVGYGVASLVMSPSSANAGDGAVRRVPDVVGLPEAEARGRIEDTGLEFTVRGGLAHRAVPEGAVLAQSPMAGQFARPGAPVHVTLSRGPEVHTLPNVAGLSERQADIILQRLGYEVVIERREDPMASGRAVETRPAAGTELQVPEAVVLVVSEGAPIVVVPDMLGLHIDDAVQALAEAGLELGSISFDDDAPEAPGRIVGQYPPAGYNLRAGDAVELRVAAESSGMNAADEQREGPRELL
ncbi:MAG: PASTA domain-containing protein [Gemmatimonadota bacterium]|nr:PASTA domain-containing protein [Gemmatimonadota bacterium]MDH3426942.1 PASTA domain-containing protein [Gemmatimonadota bacterium]